MLNYYLLDYPCFINEEEKFIWASKKEDCFNHYLHIWSNVAKKFCQHLWGEDYVKLAFMAELLLGKKLLMKLKDVKKLQLTKAHNDLNIEKLNKVLWSKESEFEMFRSNRRVYMRRRVGERFAIPWITPSLKYGGGSVIVWGDFAD